MAVQVVPQRLYLMRVATASVPTAGGPLDMSSGCYLVAMSDGTHVLIDSGLPPDMPRAPGAAPGENEKNVIAHLADLGLRPEDVTCVICTHFDIDHVGYHASFPQAEFIVQREQYERARGGDARFAAGRAQWDHPALRYWLVAGDTEIAPGLTLIETSGHAPGHQSVLVRLPKTGPVLLVVDAVVLQRLFTPDRTPWPTDDDADRLRASTRKLLDLVAREGVTLTVFGHDGQQWRTLKRAPEYYE